MMTTDLREVYLVDGARTPFLKARGKPGAFSASDLAVNAGKELLERQSFLPTDLNEVVVGCVMPSADEANIGRVVALRLGCGQATPAWTVQRNCASGMQALDSAMKDIAIGKHDLVLAGGTESMTRAPLLFNEEATVWFAQMNAAGVVQLSICDDSHPSSQIKRREENTTKIRPAPIPINDQKEK